jgi:DNA-binding transcriptional ArsR family regulator
MLAYVEELVKEKRKEIELNEEAMNMFVEMMDDVELKTFPIVKGTTISIRTHEQQQQFQRMLKKINLRIQERDNPTKHFIINFHDTLGKIEDQLDVKTAGVALTLSLYMERKSGGLLKINGEVMTKQDIDEILGMDDETCKGHLDVLKTFEIIDYKREKVEVVETRGRNKGKTKVISANVYKINPNHHYMGYLLDGNKERDFTKVFKEAAKEYLEYVSLEARGLLYKMLRYVHFQSYYLVKNPNSDLRKDREKTFYENIKNESIKKEILNDQQDLKIQDFVEITGKSQRTIERYIKEWEYARLVIKNGRGKHATYLMNPSIFTRQESQCPYAVSTTFLFDKVKAQKAPHLKRRKK